MNGVKVLSETPTSVGGITTVRYQIPAYDRAGNVDGFKNKVFTKTVYDPKVFTDQKMLDLGQQAAASGYKNALCPVQASNRLPRHPGGEFFFLRSPRFAALTCYPSIFPWTLWCFPSKSLHFSPRAELSRPVRGQVSDDCLLVPRIDCQR